MSVAFGIVLPGRGGGDAERAAGRGQRPRSRPGSPGTGGRGGSLFPPGDDLAAAKAIRRLADDPASGASWEDRAGARPGFDPVTVTARLAICTVSIPRVDGPANGRRALPRGVLDERRS